MKINFKKPKYILPLVFLPFLCLFFYVYHSTGAGKKDLAEPINNGIQENVGGVSPEIQKKNLDDKLDAYRGQYKQADGVTAVNALQEETSSLPDYGSKYSLKDKMKLDSIDKAMKLLHAGSADPGRAEESSYLKSSRSVGYGKQPSHNDDQALAAALAKLSDQSREKPKAVSREISSVAKEKDPMDVFKAQMAYMDSVGKTADPEYQQQLQRQKEALKAEQLSKQQVRLSVHKATEVPGEFNSIYPDKRETFITAIIDENVTGYSGSRIRIRLLDDIMVGRNLVSKGTYLYALITGFSEQRVMLTISSIQSENKFLPVKLEIYDPDGMPGFYVPESAFREFTKDLGGNSMQGVNLQGSSQNQSQFLMSTMDKVFQSTSSAIASLIRKNKAKIKYSSYVYLIDPQELQTQQKSY